MKRIVASVGLVALGASSLQTASAQSLSTPDSSKPWTLSATLRGFYDDNTGTINKNVATTDGTHRDSYGMEFSPNATLLWSPQEQTTFNLGMLYSLIYYANRPPFSSDHQDQSFSFNAGVNHAFDENTKLRISDSFVLGQEPDMLRSGNSYATFQRISGDNIRNFGSLGFDHQLTPKVGFDLGYDNAYYNYKDTQVGLTPISPGVAAIQPSSAATLDRDENRVRAEGSYLVQPETKALLGYQFSAINYLSSQYIGGYLTFFGPVGLVPADERNTYEHTIYAGAEHTFLPELTGSLRAGGSYSDYYNNPGTSSSWSPYVLASMKYTYLKESSAEIGFSYDRSATDVVGLVGTGGNFTQDAEAAVVYANVTHRIMPQLYGSLIAQFQDNVYNGGYYNNEVDNYYSLGLNLEYRFTPMFSADIGYNYDWLQSNITDRSFARNRVYIGVTASY